MRITVWNEYIHEKQDEAIRAIYPDGIHNQIARALSGEKTWDIRTATLEEPDNGLPQDVVDSTDVLIWWGHKAHNQVDEATVLRVQQAVLNGMGFIALHSAHYSLPLKRLLGTGCGLSWREDGKHERLWVVDPTHPIAAGIDQFFEIPETEMYGEFFDVPPPDELVFMSWFAGGEVLRSGMVWKRGRGKVFYFRPGHETFPIYHQKEVLAVIRNACRYLRPEHLPAVTGIGDAPNMQVSPEERRA